MSAQKRRSRPARRMSLLLIPLAAVILIGWGVTASGYSVKGIYKTFAGDDDIPNTVQKRPTIDGMIDSLVMSADELEQTGEMQRAIDSLQKAVSLKYNQFLLEKRLLSMYEKKKALQREYYAKLPGLPLGEGCKGARMEMIKKLYSIDPDSISINLRKELNDCNSK